MNTALKNSLTLLALAGVLAGATAARSQTLTFDVNLDTAGLNAQDGAHAPFYLDFQLNYGNSALATNTATFSNFELTGGSPVGSAVTVGSATGSLAGAVTLTASAAHPADELYQQFAAGVTDIQFTATITETGPDVGVPTEFSAAILDSSLGFPAQLFTTAPDTESLVTLDLSSSSTLANVGAYTSLSSADGNSPVTGVAATISAIPDVSSTAVLLACGAALLAFSRRRFGRRQMA